VVACFLASACGSGGQDNLEPSKNTGLLRVVTTTAVLADLVENVGGDRVRVSPIVPPGADIHSFQTTPDDSIAISQAQLIVSNGFGLDAFLEPVLRSAMGAEAVHVIAAQGLESELVRRPASSDDGRLEDEDPESDPHFWQNPVFAIHYVKRILDGLVIADPDHAPDYRANADIYSAELRDLDREIAETLSQVRPEFRHLVTFHDAFGHLAHHYGWRVSAFVSSGADEVSPGTIVQVLDRIGNDFLPAVFVGPQFRTDVVEQAARDVGVAVGTIYSDPSDAGPTSYIEMMRSNARSLAKHLQ
jgi:ABC-type Zn uptake system ZnuABC Zn-binding protein ZnuA